MSNPILTTTNSKLDTRVKEPSGVVPPPPGVGSSGSTPDRFKPLSCVFKISLQYENNKRGRDKLSSSRDSLT